jgi:sulfonate transport system substrate-binding protein
MTPSQIGRRTLLSGALAAAVVACRKTTPEQSPVRLGWQIPLAIQGQIVQVLKRGRAGSRGPELSFAPFSYGGPQMEAALAGRLDVVFVGDQPLINLLSRSDGWRIVSRLFYTRTALLVPPGSKLETAADLRGRTIASPFGSVAHREATLWQESAGLNPASDVKNVNLDILEISNLVQTSAASWQAIDAVSVWEPTTSLLTMRDKARLLLERRTLGVAAMSRAFMEREDQAVTVMEKVLRSWAYFAQNRDEVDDWYAKDAGLSYSRQVLKTIAEIDPAVHAHKASDVDLQLSGEHIAELERSADWALRYGFVKQKPDVRRCIDTQLLAKARARIELDP